MGEMMQELLAGCARLAEGEREDEQSRIENESPKSYSAQPELGTTPLAEMGTTNRVVGACDIWRRNSQQYI